ncbi:MAG: histidine kinase [Caldithrix sp.]|nr:histidine kinase [Caldithrix sp.]
MVELKKKFEQYHFEWKHLLVLFIVLIFFQIIVSYVQKISLRDLVADTQEWYKQDSAEKMASLTTTSIELLLETTKPGVNQTSEEKRDMIRAFNIIFSQQLLEQNVTDICILARINNEIKAIDDGNNLYSIYYERHAVTSEADTTHDKAVRLYKELERSMIANERIYSIKEGDHTFHVFVPFVPKGEYSGAVYMKISPNLEFISKQVISNYDETALIFMALIFFGLLAMFYISSYTVKERDETQQLLFEEHDKYLREHITHQKESLFTQRIYHTHHKAEKVMGFIKEDLNALDPDSIENTKQRVTKYANFISRVIYDMKWYDPPVQTIRNPIFQTDLNEVINFIVDHIFLRISTIVDRIRFHRWLDESLPSVPVNEFVVWEIIEPLIQNSIDHSQGKEIDIWLITKRREQDNNIHVIIQDNGHGIEPALLETGDHGIKKIFMENQTTKTDNQNAGYGCYLSYEIAKRAGWKLDAENVSTGGCRFILTINNR